MNKDWIPEFVEFVDEVGSSVIALLFVGGLFLGLAALAKITYCFIAQGCGG